ncbi:MAG: ribulose-phosphate 3-epimerase [Chitinophagales bacterium]|nr:ribulose-phosphate 3-epimerase [Bacteroidota bacterium]MCB9043419.1 ribulose-phosphate 3-epimerase [Chitinophagales bacterium]
MQQKTPLVAPSILAADFGFLNQSVQMLNDSEADWLHLDIMDGSFVPNFSFGFPVIEAIRKSSTKPLDVHLMINEPDRYLQRFAQAGAHLISVHYEACTHLHRSIAAIKSLGCKAGVVLNPHTSVNLLDDILTEVDLVLIMSVNPGFGGQRFIENTYRKVRVLKEKLIARNASALIEIDGGVDLQNAAALVQAGADVLVAGSSVFSAKEPAKAISALKHCNTSSTIV